MRLDIKGTLFWIEEAKVYPIQFQICEIKNIWLGVRAPKQEQQNGHVW